MELKDRLSKARKDAGLTQARVAREFDVTPQAISQWERGEAIPENDKLLPLSRLYRVEPAWLLGETDLRSEDVAHALDQPPAVRMVKIKGYVGAGAKAHYYAVSQEDFEEVPAPAGATDQTVAVEIKGTSLGPLLDTWLVFYKDVRSPVESDMLGEICVVGLADDRILIKKIQRNGRGGYNLISNSADPPIEDAQIEWAAKVTDMRPRR